jgi:hypothetical protein
MAIHDGLTKRTYTITTCALLFQQRLETDLKWQQEKEQSGRDGTQILRDSGNQTTWIVEEELLPWPKLETTETK